MRSDGTMLVLVQAGLWGLYVLIPWLALRPRLAREVWPVRLVGSLLAGVVSQVVLGLVWSTWVRQPAWLEGLTYLGFWIITAVLVRVHQPAEESGAAPELLTLFDQVCLAAMVVLGLAIRLRHPLECMALGQSDAYTHLAMFREIIAQGVLGNAAYPPGYAWVMGMPAALLQIDPYFIARFGGAFWGLALSFSIYGFLRTGVGDRRAAMIGAFLTATSPAWMLLHKTGVGAYANQAGLFLLPLVFAGALMFFLPNPRPAGAGLLMLAFAGILLTVPMLLLHVGLVLLLYVLLQERGLVRLLFRKRLHWLGALGPLLILAGLLWVRFGSRVLSMTVRVLITADEAASAGLANQTMGVGTSLRLLIGDFIRFKRWGVGNSLFDWSFALLFVLFVALIVAGVRRRKAPWVLMGCWGGLAAVQTATGWLQFTAYQREGWSLMMAVACLAGGVASWIWVHLRGLRVWMVLALLGSAGVTLWRSPAHVGSNSTAEETLVRMGRMLATYPRISPSPDLSMKGISGFLRRHVRAGEPLSLITRPLMQDVLFSSVTGPNPLLWISRWDIYQDPAYGLNQSPQSLVFIDHPNSLDVEQLGPFAGISPVAARNFMQQQRISYGFNETLEDRIRSLPTSEWAVARYDVDSHLRLYHVSSLPGSEKRP